MSFLKNAIRKLRSSSYLEGYLDGYGEASRTVTEAYETLVEKYEETNGVLYRSSNEALNALNKHNNAPLEPDTVVTARLAALSLMEHAIKVGWTNDAVVFPTTSSLTRNQTIYAIYLVASTLAAVIDSFEVDDLEEAMRIMAEGLDDAGAVGDIMDYDDFAGDIDTVIVPASEQ